MLRFIANSIQNIPRTSVKELEKEMPTNVYTNSKHMCILTQFCRWPGIISTRSWWLGIYGKKTKGRIRKIGAGHKFRKKTKYICKGEGKEILKFDGGEEIKPCTECTYLGTKIYQVGDNTTEIKQN